MKKSFMVMLSIALLLSSAYMFLNLSQTPLFAESYECTPFAHCY